MAPRIGLRFTVTARRTRDAGRLLAVVALLPVCGACAPKVLLERPGDWPTEWAGRRLFHTPHAYIYASSPAAAGELDRLVAATAREFADATGVEPTKGLVVVNDAEDPLIADDATALLTLVMRAQAAERAQDSPEAASALDDSGSDAAFDAQTQKREYQALGLRLDSLLKSTPFAVPRQELARTLKLPVTVADAVPWAASLPTQRACQRLSHEMIAAALRSEEITLAQRLLMLPWVPLIEVVTAEELGAERDPVVFECFLRAASGWSDEQKRRFAALYRDRRERDRAARMDARRAQMEQRTTPATQPAQSASQPAPATAEPTARERASAP